MSRLIPRMADRKFYDVSCGMVLRQGGDHAPDGIGQVHLHPGGALDLSFKRMRIEEVPAARGVREFGRSRVAGDLWKYGTSAGDNLRCYRDYRPMRFFAGWPCLYCSGIALELFMFGYYFTHGSFSPHKWAGFSGAGLAVLGLLFLHMGLMGDMLDRHRAYLEEMIYMIRKNEHDWKRDRAP